jgi:hypothetical protein
MHEVAAGFAFTRTAILLLAGCLAGELADAADMSLSCLLDDAVSHGQRTLKIGFNERAQYATVNGKTAVAGITGARIAFRMELSDGAPLDFVVDRVSGAITISSIKSGAASRVIYTGQCKTVDD